MIYLYPCQETSGGYGIRGLPSHHQYVAGHNPCYHLAVGYTHPGVHPAATNTHPSHHFLLTRVKNIFLTFVVVFCLYFLSFFSSPLLSLFFSSRDLIHVEPRTTIALRVFLRTKFVNNDSYYRHVYLRK